MKTKALCTTTVILSTLFLSVNTWAEKVEIKREFSPAKSKQFEIPVDVDWNNPSLRIHFQQQVKQVFIIVTGPEGIVYRQEVTTDNARTIYVDLERYRDGEYTIRFQDAEGNEVSGDFWKEEGEGQS